MDVGLDFGFFGINNGPFSDPAVMARVAKVCEDAGFDSVWTGEHVVLPDPQAPPSPAAPETDMLDGAIALTWVAAHTTRLKLGTGIIILPQRNPLVLAKELASLDHLSAGRLIFGVGVGYLEPEFRALGIPFEDRGGRTVDYLAAMRAVWAGADHAGTYSSFSGVKANPQPVQQPHPPIVMGGHSAAAFRRAVTGCDGWYGFGLDLDSTKTCIEGLAAAAARYERPDHLGALHISVTPRRVPDDASVAAYRALGVHRLVPMAAPRATVDETIAVIEGLAERHLR
jgi:probable F420-dependent oxidoreductase